MKPGTRITVVCVFLRGAAGGPVRTWAEQAAVLQLSAGGASGGLRIDGQTDARRQAGCDEAPTGAP